MYYRQYADSEINHGFAIIPKAIFSNSDTLNEKGSESVRPLGLHGSVRRKLGLIPIFPLTLPGTGGSRVQRHESEFMNIPKGIF
jgi:hypothetical protein